MDHISEEVWLIDDKKSCNVGGANWVAAGEATWVGHTGNWYFWEECKVGHGNDLYFQYQPPGGDVYSYFKYVIAASGPNYAVTMYTAGGGPQTQLWSGSSINNVMAPDVIEFGLEATNTATQSSDYDYFENNQFSPDGSSWYYFTEGGSPASYNPPYWRWVTVPTPGGTGGFAETKCCWAGLATARGTVVWAGPKEYDIWRAAPTGRYVATGSRNGR